MRILEGLDGLRAVPPGAVLSVGNFDGVHRGHAEILRRARALAAGEAGRRGDTGTRREWVVVTFEPHPLTVLRPEAVPPRLTVASLKRKLIERAGVDAMVVLPPTPEVLGLAAEDFWAILRDDVRPAHLVEGETFTFGKGRRGTVERLREWVAGSGVDLHVVTPVSVPLLDMQVVPVSSSLVRWLLSNGRVRDAGICLGRAYALEGEVVKGHQRGRTIGVPTANLDCHGQMIPAEGVYAGRCEVDGKTYAAALSVGTMPTFGEKLNRQVEAHLLEFDGDLYGKTLTVEVTDWVRGQQKFDGVEALKKQMARDIAYCAERKGLDAGRTIVSASV